MVVALCTGAETCIRARRPEGLAAYMASGTQYLSWDPPKKLQIGPSILPKICGGVDPPLMWDIRPPSNVGHETPL